MILQTQFFTDIDAAVDFKRRRLGLVENSISSTEFLSGRLPTRIFHALTAGTNCSWPQRPIHIEAYVQFGTWYFSDKEQAYQPRPVTQVNEYKTSVVAIELTQPLTIRVCPTSLILLSRLCPYIVLSVLSKN
jgi:hypothetical protein